MDTLRPPWLPVLVILTVIALFGTMVQSSMPIVDDETFKAHFPTVWASGISPLCYNDSKFFLQAYMNRDKWATEMYKATGSLPIEGIRNFEVFSTSPGLFDQCLSVGSTNSFQGQFCSVFFKQEPLPDSLNKVATNNEQDGDGRTFRLPRVGFCIPSSCSPRDFRSSVAQLVARHQYHNNNNNISLTITTISDENYCYTKNKIALSAQTLDGADFGVLVILILLATLVLSGTLYDGWRSFKNQSIDTKTKKILVCFSALENGRKVLSTKAIPSDLSCLHGIRVLSATWIILLHTYIIITVNQTNIKFGPDKNFLIDYSSQGITRGAMAVDTFFLMGGLLVSHSLLRELKRNNGQHLNLFSFYIRRFLRISPFYFLYIGFMSTLVIFIGTGPLWYSVHQKREMCRSVWWTHILYINNYFLEVPCMGQAWYLASDMQLFILSPLFVYPLWRWRRAGLAWNILAITAIIVAIGTLFVVWSLPVAEIRFERRNEAISSPYFNFYFETWARLPQYLSGILLGWFISNRNKSRSVSLNWIGVITGWLLSIATILVVIYGMVPFLDEDLVPTMNPFIRVTYGTLSRFGWALSINWIVFACFYGYGGFVNSFLSWKGFMPLGRLSFIAYLVHFDFIKTYYIGISRTPFYYTIDYLVLNYFAMIVVAFVLAFILSIAVEMPFINLGRMVLSPTREITNISSTTAAMEEPNEIPIKREFAAVEMLESNNKGS